MILVSHTDFFFVRIGKVTQQGLLLLFLGFSLVLIYDAKIFQKEEIIIIIIIHFSLE